MKDEHKKSSAAGHSGHGPVASSEHGHSKNKHPGKETAGKSTDKSVAGITAEMHDEVVRERDEYLDSLQRLQAEFANFRKRVLRDSEQQSQQASIRIIEELLPVLDNFERAMKAAADHDEKLLEGGVELVYNQLRDILSKRGLCEIEAEGATFDPNRHEAVMCKPSAGSEEGTVIDVLEKGYEVDGKVVRPAKVIVSTIPDENNGSDSS